MYSTLNSPDQDQVRLFASHEGTDSILLAKIQGPILRGDMNGFHWSETSFHEQFDLALIAKPGSTPTFPVGSGPASSKPPALTKAISKSISFRSNAALEEAKGTLARAVR